MAGGRGKRLSPITDKTPKSMLPLGDKPIMRHYVDKLKNYGIGNFGFVSIILVNKFKNILRMVKEK